MRSAPKPGVQRFVLVWHRAVLGTAFGFMTAVFVSMVPEASSDPAALAFFAIGGALMVFATVRAFLSARIELGTDEVRISGILRTRGIPWGKVSAVSVATGSSAALIPWRVPLFHLTDGSTCLADDFRLRNPSIVDAVVAEAALRVGQAAESSDIP